MKKLLVVFLFLCLLVGIATAFTNHVKDFEGLHFTEDVEYVYCSELVPERLMQLETYGYDWTTTVLEEVYPECS